MVCGTVLVLLAGAVSGLAQGNETPQRGFWPGGSYGLGDIETINTTNGNLLFNIPLVSLPPGHGGSPGASVNLVYNSKLWDTFGSVCYLDGIDYGGTDLRPSPEGGWRYGFGYQLQLFDYYSDTGVSGDDCIDPASNDIYLLKVSFPDGSLHEFYPLGYRSYRKPYSSLRPDGWLHSCYSGDNPYITGTMTYFTIDGTYLRLDIQHDGDGNWANNPWTLSFPDGRHVTGGNANQRIYDRNNNYVEIQNITYNNHPATRLLDQLNRSLIIEYDSATGQDYVYKWGVGNEQLKWTVKWKTITVAKTYWVNEQLGCSCAAGGVWQNLAGVETITLPSQVGSVLNYTFDYNQVTANPTYENPSYGWGEVSSATLPTGASVSYAYDTDGSGYCAFAWRAVVENSPARKTLTYSQEYDGSSTPTTESWLYAHTTNYCQTTAPDGGITVEHFGYGEGVDADKGRVYKSEMPDRTIERIWQRNSVHDWVYLPGFGGNTGGNPYLKTEFTSLKDPSGNLVKTAIKDYHYDKNGNVTRVAEYDWVDYSAVPHDGYGRVSGIPAGAVLKRVTVNNYYSQTPDASDSSSDSPYSYWNASSPSLRSALSWNEVSDGVQTLARSELFYDIPSTTGNLIQKTTWDSTKGGYSNPLMTGNSISASAQYNQYGSPTLTTDARGTQTLLTYGPVGGISDLYPTQIQTAYGTSVQRTEVRAYDFPTGLVTSATDADNNVSTLTSYDVFGRPTLAQVAAGKPEETRTSTEYSDTNRRVIVRSDLNTLGDGKLVKIQHYDQLGRVRLSRQLEDSTTQSATDETAGIKVQTRYLFNGSNSYTLSSNPYRTAYSSQESDVTMGWTRSKSDNTGRVIEAQTFGGSGLPGPWGSNTTSTGTVTTAYDANFTTVTDQAGKMRRSITNGLGQLARVDEPGDPNTNNSLGTTDNPGQPTSYTYDALGNLVTVNQGSQTRSFAYSSLSRLLTALNPESGTLSYQYDNNGNLLQKTDPRLLADNQTHVTITYDYDALNRVKTRTYNDGTAPNYTDRTPAVTYTYDTVSAYGKGRLASVSSSVSGYSYSGYDAVGRVLGGSENISGQGSQTYSMSYSYDLAGHVLTEAYPSGHAVTNTYDNAGRLSSFTGNLGDGTTPRTYSTGISYDSASHWTREQFGTNTPTPLYNKRHYNNREQLYDMRLSTVNDDGDGNRGAIVNYYSLANFWGVGATGTDTNGNLYAQQHWVPDGQGWTIHQQNYDYDSLNRLRWMAEYLNASQNTGSQSYSYDRYGNRTVSGFGAGINTQQFSIDPNTNRYGVPSGQSGTMNYDAAGNLKYDSYSGEGTRTYDAENRMTQAWGNNQWQTYSYDGDGRRVKRNVNGAETWQVYGLGGELVAEYAANTSAASPQKEYGYRNGELLITASSGQGCGVGYNGTKTWSATDGALGHVVGHAEGSDWAVYAGSDSANFMSYGPYDNTFGQGHHTAQFTLMVDNTSGTDVVANIDVVTGFGGNVLAQRQIHRNEFAAANQWQVFTLEFDNPCFGLLEARVYWYGTVNMKFHQLAISPVSTAGVDVEWLVTDQLGTPRMIADQTDSLAGVKRHDYLPFGEELYAGVSSRTAQQGYTSDSVRQKFTQKERDSETGLDYFGARYYGSTPGRFTSVDPMAGHTEDPQTLNRYVYARNNPQAFVDPNGQDFYLPCKEESKTCHGGQEGTYNRKGNFTGTRIGNDKNGSLVDQNGIRYTANITGKGVWFTQVGGNRSTPGVFQNGTNATTIQGSASNGLEGFRFTFTRSNLSADVTAAGTFSFNGTSEQIKHALENAGYQNYWQDATNVFHLGMEDYRSHGNNSGEGSGHFAVDAFENVPVPDMGYERVRRTTVPTTGDMHFGETNPWVSMKALKKHAGQVKRSIWP